MPDKKVKKDEKKNVIKETVVKAVPPADFTRAVGRRKTAVAQVRFYPQGTGKITVNKKDFKEYFPYFELNQKITAPLKLVGKRNDFDFSIKVIGGGKLGQAEACRHGIARALVKFNAEDYKKPLRAGGFLTRDPRSKERKKPGLKRARRAPQWSKR